MRKNLSTHPIVDPNAVERLRKLGGDELLHKMINAFLPFAEKQMSSLRSGFHHRDFAAVERASHSLKSSAGNFGATSLYRVADQIEQLAGQKEEKTLVPLVKLLERSLSEMVTELRKVLERSEP